MDVVVRSRSYGCGRAFAVMVVFMVGFVVVFVFVFVVVFVAVFVCVIVIVHALVFVVVFVVVIARINMIMRAVVGAWWQRGLLPLLHVALTLAGSGMLPESASQRAHRRERRWDEYSRRSRMLGWYPGTMSGKVGACPRDESLPRRARSLARSTSSGSDTSAFVGGAGCPWCIAAYACG